MRGGPLLLPLLLPLVVADRCDYDSEQTVALCLQPMLQYASQLQDDTGMQFPLHGGSIFRKLCSMYQQFQECVEDLQCTSISVDAVVASYGFMCGAGMAQFESHAGCFAEVERDTNYIKCKEVATAAMTDAQNKYKNAVAAPYLKAMCTAMEGYLRCSQPSIHSKCGTEAWHLVSTVTRDSLRVTMPDCHMGTALF